MISYYRCKWKTWLLVTLSLRIKSCRNLCERYFMFTSILIACHFMWQILLCNLSCMCTCLTINICQLLMICFRFNNTITMQRNYRLDPMTWWNPGLEFMSQYQLLKLGFPEDTMLYQVEPYIQMLMKSSIYKGLWCTRYVCHLTVFCWHFCFYKLLLLLLSFNCI